MAIYSKIKELSGKKFSRVAAEVRNNITKGATTYLANYLPTTRSYFLPQKFLSQIMQKTVTQAGQAMNVRINSSMNYFSEYSVHSIEFRSLRMSLENAENMF